MSRNYKDHFGECGFYHIYNKVISETILFRSKDDYQFFLSNYLKYLSPYFDTFGYCLIPNHYHFLVRVKNHLETTVAKEQTNAAKKYINGEKPLNFFLEHQLSRMFSSISLRHNKLYQRTGPLFKEGTKRVELTTESRIINQLWIYPPQSYPSWLNQNL